MFFIFLKSAYRSLSKKKFYTIINVLGLAIGLTCAILIGLYVRHELSYDTYHKDHELIYRVESHFEIQGTDDLFAATAFPLARALAIEYPEIESFCRLMPMDNNLFIYGDQKFQFNDVYFADSSAFNMFSYEFLAGNPEKCLENPLTILLTQSMAEKIFGKEDPMNKQIQIGDGRTYTVTALIRDVPSNTHMKFNALTSMTSLIEVFGKENYYNLSPNAFWNIGFYSYIKLHKGSDISKIAGNLGFFYEKYINSVGKQINASFEMMFQPISRVHLYSKVGYDLPRGNLNNIYAFLAVAFFLLLIGCINYMNLATAYSGSRALEVGIRKVVGADKGSIQRQFLTESVLIAFLAFVLAFVAALAMIPLFRNLTGIPMEFSFKNNWIYLAAMFGISLLTGLISGSYPSFYLSSFLPVKVLKGNSMRNSKSFLRKLLVIVQFSISIILIIGTITVIRQLSFVRNTDLGFDDDNLLTMTVRDTSAVKNMSTILEEIKRNPNVINTGLSNSHPGEGYGIIVQRYETPDGTMAEKGINFLFVDQDYLKTMNVIIAKGRDFDSNNQTDYTEACIVNEACAEKLGWGDAALGKKLDFGADLDGTASLYTKVIGVVKDFNYLSLHNKVDPVVILLSTQPLRNISIRIKGENVNETLDYLKSIWQKFCPVYPFEYQFLDDSLQKQYLSEQKLGKMFTYLSFICIFIACLGLFGLAAYTAEQRTKEIGIRKVMGATIMNIVMSLSKEFLIWVIISNALAWPIAWYMMNKWLQNYAYHVEIPVSTYILSGIIALLIAIVTVCFRALKAAYANPIESLRYE